MKTIKGPKSKLQWHITNNNNLQNYAVAHLFLDGNTIEEGSGSIS